MPPQADVKPKGTAPARVAVPAGDASPVPAATGDASPRAVRPAPAGSGASQPPPTTSAAVIAEPGKLARARAELLCDPGTFHPHRSAVGDGVIAGSGKVGGRAVYVWAQDVTFK